ncbi:cysteinyl leukotriene receptor 1 [Scyliorhinus canicula]|uniref:cysteinyl leukotriene receptor 1 n=1 Tax=Scyliorhinus canicula TaxID=7830 RepID=UPI0018F33C7B|nr:cysteinyl leukotriene receptor 1 [Scyliorhinus canicula]XP_038638356.1 cysteinyl leukotriene receptor 1 [Scyliorhinus canicula]
MTFNTSISNPACKPQKLVIFIPTFLGVVFMIGFVLSALSLYTFWFRFKKWKTGMIIQFNLALSDISIAPAAPLMIIYFSMANHWPFGQFLCQLKVFLLFIHMYGSIYFLTLVSLHRYITVVRLTEHSIFKNQRFMKAICIGVWVFLFINALPFFFILKTSEMSNVTQCLRIHQTEMSFVYFTWSMVNIFPGFIIPFMVSVTCYSLLGFYIVKMDTSLSKRSAMKVKSMGMIAVSLVIFLVCCLPVQVSRLVGVIVQQSHPEKCQWLYKIENIYYASIVLANVNCCLDPLLYWFSSRKFQEAFKGTLSLFRCHCKQCNPSSRADTSIATARPTA